MWFAGRRVRTSIEVTRQTLCPPHDNSQTCIYPFIIVLIQEYSIVYHSSIICKTIPCEILYYKLQEKQTRFTVRVQSTEYANKTHRVTTLQPSSSFKALSFSACGLALGPRLRRISFSQLRTFRPLVTYRANEKTKLRCVSYRLTHSQNFLLITELIHPSNSTYGNCTVLCAPLRSRECIASLKEPVRSRRRDWSHYRIRAIFPGYKTDIKSSELLSIPIITKNWPHSVWKQYSTNTRTIKCNTASTNPYLPMPSCCDWPGKKKPRRPICTSPICGNAARNRMLRSCSAL